MASNDDYLARLRQLQDETSAALAPLQEPEGPQFAAPVLPRYQAPEVVPFDLPDAPERSGPGVEQQQPLPQQPEPVLPSVPAPQQPKQVDLKMGKNVPPMQDFGKPTKNGLLANVASNAAQLQKRFPGLRLTSGYRDPAHNARVGGVPNSYHTKGRAVDFGGSAKDMAAGAAYARTTGAREVLVHKVAKGGGVHLHVAW